MYHGDRRVRIRPGLLLLTACLLGLTPRLASAQAPIVIDHTCTDLSQIPAYWIEQAKDMFRLSYGHTSHGSQIVSGIETLKGILGCSCASCGDAGCSSCLCGYCDDYYYYKYGGTDPVAPPGTLSFWDGKPEGASDLGNPDRTQWEIATRAMLDDPSYENRNLVMWSWCGQADGTEAEIQQYLDLMSGLETDYPDVTFVYMTGHLNGTGEEGNLHQRNNQIRQHAIANDAVLFDFADIESYDPDGNYFLDLYADDGCNYVGGNWADEWCAANSGNDLCTPNSCAHSQPLNCSLKGRAFWWMMARLAGWPGPGGTTTPPPTTTTSTAGSTTTTSTTPGTTTTTLPSECAAAPKGGCIMPGKGLLLVKGNLPGKEKLKVLLNKLTPAVSPSQFGNPVTGATTYNVCIYDEADGLVGQMRVARAQEDCGTPPRPCWKALSGKGYKYNDKDIAEDGIEKIIAKAGDVGKGKLIVKGKNNASRGQTSLPVGIAEALQDSARVTVQVVTGDADCFAVRVTDVKKADGSLFKALGEASPSPAFLETAAGLLD